MWSMWSINTENGGRGILSAYGPLQLINLVLQGSASLRCLVASFSCGLRLQFGNGLVHFRLHGFLGVPIVLRQKRGVEVHLHHAALRLRAARARHGAQHVVCHIARRIAQRPRRRVGGNHRRSRNDQRAVERLVRDVRDIHHHAQPVHLVHHVFAELAQALLGVRDARVVGIARAVGPAIRIAPRQRHVAHAQRVELPQQGQRVLNRMPALDAHQRRQLVIAVRLLNPRRATSQTPSDPDASPPAASRRRSAPACAAPRGPCRRPGRPRWRRTPRPGFPCARVSRLKLPPFNGSPRSKFSSTKRCGVSACVSITIAERCTSAGVGDFDFVMEEVGWLALWLRARVETAARTRDIDTVARIVLR